MKKNIIFKALAIVFVFVIFAIPSFSKNINNNAISKIIIEKSVNNSYIINLLFNEDYKGNAFLQKRDFGSYQVFLPDTQTSSKRTQIIYKNSNDKDKINLRVEEKPIIKGHKKSKYVKIGVEMADDYSIKLVSGLASSYTIKDYLLQSNNLVSAITLIILAFAIFLLSKAIRQSNKTKLTNNHYTSYPSEFLNSPKEYYNATIKKEEEEEKKREERKLQKQEIKSRIQHADKKTFDCFELPYAEDMKKTQNNTEFTSSLKQASELLKEKPSLVKLRHTNPIKRSNKTNSSTLQMPAIEDVIPEKKTIHNSAENNQSTNPENAELLSVLNITPNKGFYLTTVNNTLALFGFINENVFLFKKFKDLSQINLQARFYDKHGDNDIYIVRLDSYKAMIEISENSMQELAKI